MRLVVCPRTDHAEDLKLVASEMSGGANEISEHLRLRVEAAYAVYSASILLREQCRAIRMRDDEGDCLRGSYKALRRRVALRPIRDSLLAAPIHGLCPYCGVNQVSTLDHFAPKASFPEFAVYGLNLVACCGECNTLKGDAGASSVHEIPWLHPYVESLTEGDVRLRASLTVVDGNWAAIFGLEFAESVPDDSRRRVSAQFSRLNLAERLSRAGARELASIKTSLSYAPSMQNAEAFRVWCELALAGAVSSDGEAGYRAAILRAILCALENDSEFLQSIAL